MHACKSSFRIAGCQDLVSHFSAALKGPKMFLIHIPIHDLTSARLYSSGLHVARWKKRYRILCPFEALSFMVMKQEYAGVAGAELNS